MTGASSPVQTPLDQGAQRGCRVPSGVRGLREWLSASMRGSVKFSIDVEHSLALIIAYGVIGGVAAYVWS